MQTTFSNLNAIGFMTTMSEALETFKRSKEVQTSFKIEGEVKTGKSFALAVARSVFEEGIVVEGQVLSTIALYNYLHKGTYDMNKKVSTMLTEIRRSGVSQAPVGFNLNHELNTLFGFRWDRKIKATTLRTFAASFIITMTVDKDQLIREIEKVKPSAMLGVENSFKYVIRNNEHEFELVDVTDKIQRIVFDSASVIFGVGEAVDATNPHFQGRVWIANHGGVTTQPILKSLFEIDGEIFAMCTQRAFTSIAGKEKEGGSHE